MFLSSVSANIVILKKWRFNIVINIIKLIFYNDIREKIEVHIVIFLPKMEVQSVIFDPQLGSISLFFSEIFLKYQPTWVRFSPLTLEIGKLTQKLRARALI